MEKSAIVTGCFGFIGSHLVDLLLERGYLVFGVGKPRKEKHRNFSGFIDSSQFQLLGQDVLDFKSQSDIPENIDTLYHLATAREPESPQRLTEVNVIGTINMLELAHRFHMRRVVFISSAAVYGNPNTEIITEQTLTSPLNFYAASKLSAEKYVKVYNLKHGIETVILRYHNVYGPRKVSHRGAITNFVNRALRDESIKIEGNGSYRYNPIYVKDIVEVTYRASQVERANGEIINIGGPETVTLLDIIKQVKHALPESRSEVIFSESRSNWGDAHICDTSYMAEILGFSPTQTLENTLSPTIQWYQSEI